MRTELPLPATLAANREAKRPLPFVIRHLAGCKPNRLAASVRIPVTPANRALLRALRAAELTAWEKALPGTELAT